MNLVGPVLLGTWVAVVGMLSTGWGQESRESLTSPVINAVEIRIGAVLASNSGQEFDSRLASLHRQFNILFPYTSYHLVKEERLKVPWGGKVAFDVPGGRYVLVVPREFKNERVAMKVMVIEGSRPIVDTVLSLRNHATLLIGGPRQADGVLILAIGADTLP